MLLVAAPLASTEETPSFDGEWRTSRGIVTLKQVGSKVTGTYGAKGLFTLEGEVQGTKLTFSYREENAAGSAQWTLDALGHAFSGSFVAQDGRKGQWQGWRADPEAVKGEAAKLAGLWLTDFGLMELEQDGEKVKGRYALRGVSELAGAVTGRQFEFTFNSYHKGKGWFDTSSDGDALAGAANSAGFVGWYGWRGRRASEFVRHVKLVPGKIVDGSTEGLLTYAARAPEGYREGDGKKWPAVVILHGSNMNVRSYVATIASASPDVARDYLLIGINGETPSDIGKEPRFNYTYVSFVGRSKFKGFAGTDRESPALVAEALKELRGVYPVSKYFVGGHSQGGFLTYSLLMNFPELIAGAFPVSAGVIIQCEPDAYEDEHVRTNQRAVPLAIVHGRQDRVVGFDMGEYAATQFGEAGWRARRFFADESGAGHRFAMLPVREAIRWLEAHAGDDPKRLIEYAEQRVRAKAYHDAIAAMERAAASEHDEAVKARVERLRREVDAKARAGAERFLPLVRKGEGGPWVDELLAYRDDFEFAPAARELMEAFGALRAQHEGPAKKLMDEARAAFNQRRREEGYAKYQEVVEEYFAASSYRNVKRWLAGRE